MSADRDAYAYCDREHPGGDAEAKQWHEWYHRSLPAPPREAPAAESTETADR